jgi:hypothetical protein
VDGASADDGSIGQLDAQQSLAFKFAIQRSQSCGDLL